MGIAILLLVLFLLVLAVVGFAAVRIFTTRDAAGNSQPLGCLSGCAVAIGLFFLGVLGLAAFTAALALLIPARLIEHGPIEKVWIGKYDGAHDSDGKPIELLDDPTRPLHVVVEVRGTGDVSRIVERIERMGDGETSTRVQRAVNESGEAVQVIDVAFRASKHDIREMEDALRDVMPELLSEGVNVEIRGVHRE